MRRRQVETVSATQLRWRHEPKCKPGCGLFSHQQAGKPLTAAEWNALHLTCLVHMWPFWVFFLFFFALELLSYLFRDISPTRSGRPKTFPSYHLQTCREELQEPPPPPPPSMSALIVISAALCFCLYCFDMVRILHTYVPL